MSASCGPIDDVEPYAPAGRCVARHFLMNVRRTPTRPLAALRRHGQGLEASGRNRGAAQATKQFMGIPRQLTLGSSGGRVTRRPRFP